ncbi:phage tail protein, partial [Klebsiella pneumoniae]|nr:phage tail protein [Klebsiella pneumoniae]
MAAAAITGQPVGFAFMGVGDGGGVVPSPDPAQVSLVNERYRAA